MTKNEITQIESSLSVSLPVFYRTTMFNYPFPTESFEAEFLLPNDPENILACNKSPEYTEIEKPFVVGSDGGDEIYFIDLKTDSSQVFTFNMKTGNNTAKAKDWSEYLRQIEVFLKDIEDDEAAERERRANKEWWEFWK